MKGLNFFKLGNAETKDFSKGGCYMRKIRRRTISQMIDENKKELHSNDDNILKKLEERLEKRVEKGTKDPKKI